MSWRADDFDTAAELGALLARDYSRPMLALLVTYQDLAASEAASRLKLHTRTAQDFLDALVELGIAAKTEVREGKRPYYRYALAEHELAVKLDLAQLASRSDDGDGLSRRIRERAGSGADFAPARGANLISRVSFWDDAEGADQGNGSGRGTRARRQRRLNLTAAQGAFLYHLPFPGADAMSVEEIMHRAGLDPSVAPEVLDVVGVLEAAGVVETV